MRKYITKANVIYTLSMLYAIGVMTKVFYDRSQLPEGVCPVTNNNLWVYSAIGVLLVSVVVTTLLERKSKKDAKEE